MAITFRAYLCWKEKASDPVDYLLNTFVAYFVSPLEGTWICLA